MTSVRSVLTPYDVFRVKDYYSKMEPRDAIIMVCEDIAAAIGEDKVNGSA